VLAALVAVVLAAAGCSGNGEGAARSTTIPPPRDEPSGILAGLKGTAPLAEVPQSLAQWLRTIAPTLGADAPQAIRPYDAVVVAALAAEVARSDAPAKMAAEVIGVTGGGGDKCTTFQECTYLTDQLKDPDYDGPSGKIELLADGQSGDATFGVYQFGADDRLSQVSTESAEVPTPQVTLDRPDPTTGPRADGVLKIAMVLPTTGPLARQALAARAGIRVAVDEVNQDGGVLGRPIQLTDVDGGDGGTSAAAAGVAAAVTGGNDVVIGGLAAEDTTALVEPTTTAGMLLISPGASGTITARGATSGLFFRLSPPVSIQGDVLASAVADDGVTQATIVYAAGPDGQAIDAAFGPAFTGLDGTVVAQVAAAPGEQASAVIDRATTTQAGGYVLVGDDETVGTWLAAMRERGLGPLAAPTYVANISTALLSAAA
jgi:ABC-type branched-subunit amino acid transport system substrate-binding protein